VLKDENPLISVSRQVLQKMETVTAASTIVASHAYVDRWITFDKLVDSEPTLDNPTLQEIAMLSLSGLEGLIWRKASPTVVSASGSDIQISQEYHGAVPPTPGTRAEAVWILANKEIIDVTP
jgi:hypothetical protein